MPSNEMQVGDSVRAAVRGDARAWDVLVRRYTPLIRRVARGYRLAPHAIDDVVQACWLSALGSLHTLREPEAVGAWLMTTARRQSLRAHQDSARELLRDSPCPDTYAAPDCLEREVMATERAEILRDAVRRLSGRQRSLLEALIAEPDRSYVEVSEGLGMPIGSIGPTRERGLSRLREDERLAAVMAP
jgi:RNA polymerase sigma factor (sigma-70 family)